MTLIPRRFDERLRRLVHWGAYPVLLGTTVTLCTLALMEQWPYKTVYGLTVLGIVAALLTLEFLFPYRDEWPNNLFFEAIGILHVFLAGIAASQRCC